MYVYWVLELTGWLPTALSADSSSFMLADELGSRFADSLLEFGVKFPLTRPDDLPDNWKRETIIMSVCASVCGVRVREYWPCFLLQTLQMRHRQISLQSMNPQPKITIYTHACTFKHMNTYYIKQHFVLIKYLFFLRFIFRRINLECT